MRLIFEPKKTREAVTRIATLFGNSNGTPLGLDALFDRLARMDVDHLARFAEQTNAAQIDLLCDQYSKAPGARVLWALSLVLCFRKDRRWVDVGRFYFFQNPPATELRQWQQLWPKLSPELFRPSDASWLVRFLERGNEVSPLDFVIAELAHFPFDSLDERFFRTPLFEALTDYLFLEGGPLLQRLHAEPAAQRVARYLATGDDQRVLGYLRHYPATRWKPEFLERLYMARGRPDPKSAPFYKGLDEAVLWGIRQQLFRSRMMTSASPKQQQAFWMERLHRCQDWVYADGVTHITVAPLKVVEKLDYSLVSLIHGEREVARVNHGAGFVSAMHEIVTDYLGW